MLKGPARTWRIGVRAAWPASVAGLGSLLPARRRGPLLLRRIRGIRGIRGLGGRLLGSGRRRGADSAEDRGEELLPFFIMEQEPTGALRLFVVAEQEREGARLVVLPERLLRCRDGAEQAQNLVRQPAGVGLIGLPVVLLIVLDIAPALPVEVFVV